MTLLAQKRNTHNATQGSSQQDNTNIYTVYMNYASVIVLARSFVSLVLTSVYMCTSTVCVQSNI